MSNIDISEQLHELQGVFPEATRDDFYELDNGNIAVAVKYHTEDYTKPNFDVLIEFPQNFPQGPPEVWVIEPEIKEGTGHVWGRDQHGHAKICYIKPDKWSPNYTVYDTALMAKTWFYAYCNWLDSGDWDWEEAPHSLSEGLIDGIRDVFG
jgi:ubiquitin-protein ligase